MTKRLALRNIFIFVGMMLLAGVPFAHAAKGKYRVVVDETTQSQFSQLKNKVYCRTNLKGKISVGKIRTKEKDAVTITTWIDYKLLIKKNGNKPSRQKKLRKKRKSLLPLCTYETYPELPITNKIERDGITFHFQEKHYYGQFANGDYWIVGPVNIDAISPDYEKKRNGWEVNPSDPVEQGFDGRIASFDANRIPDLPYTAEPGSSIVKSVSLTPKEETCRPCLKKAAVLTVLNAPPPDNGATVWRPPYFGSDKPLYSTSDIQTDLLPEVEGVEGAPSLEEVASEFGHLWLDHKNGWTGREMHPDDYMPDYGSGIGVATGDAVLRLFFNDSVEAKMPALINVLQYGIDLYHMALGGTNWGPDGGHGNGRMLPLALTATLLDHEGMKSLFTIDNTSLFGEAGSVWIASEDRALWGQPDLYNLYWTNQIDDSGSRTAQDPYGYIDGGRLPSGSYQFCCNSATWRSAAVAVNLMPELRAVWNNESFMEYEKRWVSFGAWTQPDPCAPVEGTCTGGSNAGAKCTSASETSSTPRCGTGTCTMNSDLLGVTYGDDGTGDCIADADSSDGVGRFPALHGASSNDGDWTSTFAAQMLDAYPLE